MFPLFYGDAGRKNRANKARPLLTLPGLDSNYYPEIEADGGLERFGEVEGMFQMEFPLGLPYMDFVAVDLLSRVAADFVFPLPHSQEVFVLENIFLSWPNQGAGAYPATNPAGNVIPMPTIQIASSDPRLRKTSSTHGPNMFWKPIPLNHVGNNRAELRYQTGVNFYHRVGDDKGLDQRRVFHFSERDMIQFRIQKAPGTTEPRWVGVGIAGRMVAEKFLQGVIR